jgi:hypothetical protein
MPNIDTSDYIRRRRLATIQYANQAADQRKFRALTRFDSYSTSTAREVGIVCNDDCERRIQKDHNIFAAKQVSGAKNPHF